MAAIDKTYISSIEQYDEIIEWANKQTVQVTPSGEQWHIKEYILYDRETVKLGLEKCKEIPIWNTPTVVDAWLKENCPIKVVQDRLLVQYGNEPILIKEETIPTTKFKILEAPRFNLRSKGWDVYINDYVYNDTTKKWTKSIYSLYYSSCAWYKNMSIRKLKRLIKRWKLPAGTIIVVMGRYYGQNYRIKLCS